MYKLKELAKQVCFNNNIPSRFNIVFAFFLCNELLHVRRELRKAFPFFLKNVVNWYHMHVINSQ